MPTNVIDKPTAIARIGELRRMQADLKAAGDEGNATAIEGQIGRLASAWGVQAADVPRADRTDTTAKAAVGQAIGAAKAELRAEVQRDLALFREQLAAFAGEMPGIVQRLEALEAFVNEMSSADPEVIFQEEAPSETPENRETKAGKSAGKASKK